MWENLWRRTVTLSREYPALWVPVILAELVSFTLRTYNHAAVVFVAGVIDRTFPSHSALIGATPAGADSLLSTFLLIAASLIGFLVAMARALLYTGAFVATARMTSKYGHAASVFTPVPVRKIVGLSIRGLLIAWGIGILTGIVGIAFARSGRHVVGLPWTMFLDVVGGVATSLFAYLMVPPAMRLLEGSTGSLDVRSIALGRKCAVAAVIASSGILVLCHIVLASFGRSPSQVLPIAAAVSMISALPYAPLYVALSLLAGRDVAEIMPAEIALLPEQS